MKLKKRQYVCSVLKNALDHVYSNIDDIMSIPLKGPLISVCPRVVQSVRLDQKKPVCLALREGGL